MAFFAQSGRFDVSDADAAPAIDRTQKFEDNSVLRGERRTSRTRRTWSHRRTRMTPTAVINVVGLTSAGCSATDTPHLNALARDGAAAPIRAVLPAVTCTAQATYLTGLLPRDHGIVGNGWYFRDLAQVMFWRQSNQLVAGEKVWETARRRDPAFTCAKMFWWYNMYSSAEWSVTPRPIYPADGRKIPDLYSHPADLRDRLHAELGPFPFFEFWGPNAGIPSSEWIAEAS